MKNFVSKSLFCTAFLMAFLVKTQAQSVKITVNYPPVKHEKIYLAHYFGKRNALIDSAMLNTNSTAVFTRDSLLKGGIYFVTSEKKEVLFELLIDADQQFTISADKDDPAKGVSFTGSEINRGFQEYVAIAGKHGAAVNQLRQLRSATTVEQEQSQYDKKIQEHIAGINQYRDSIISKSPESLLALLFQAMKEPQWPAMKSPASPTDSAQAFQQYKRSYWESVPLNDDRLIRTPFFEPKLERYFRDLVSPEPDSIIAEIDMMLLYARSSPEMFQFLMVHFVQKYVNPEYMGQDAVFVHLFDKYINTGMTPFFTTQYREFLDKRAYSLMANLIGQPASNMQMLTIDGKPSSLYNINADFTVLVFWDPTCGHCKELLPKVDSIYNAKWKNEGVSIYAIKVDGPQAEWTKFIKDHKLEHWAHVYQSPAQAEKEQRDGIPNFRQLYDVYMTPALFLLDKDKRIIAKKLSYLQMDDILNLKRKQ